MWTTLLTKNLITLITKTKTFKTVLNLKKDSYTYVHQHIPSYDLINGVL